MRRLRLALIAVLVLPVVALAAPPVSPAHAQGGAVCSFAATFHVLPGYSMIPSRGTFTTDGETGSILCAGLVYGQEILGPGTFGFHGVYGTDPTGGEGHAGDTCSGGTGAGVLSMHIPTSLGLVHAEVVFTESYVGNAGQLVGSGPVAELSCLYQFRPVDGDCVTRPAHTETLTGQGVVVV